MVNVNTQVRSSMELPFGEYTLFSASMFSEGKVAAAGFFFLFGGLCCSRSRQIQAGNVIAICVCLFHTAVIQEVCQRYGGCLNRPWELGLMVMVVQRFSGVRAG